MTRNQAIMMAEIVAGYYKLPPRLQERIEIHRITNALHCCRVTDYTADYIEEAWHLVEEFLQYEV